MTDAQFFQDFEKYLFINFLQAKGSHYPNELNGYLSIYEGIVLLHDFIKITTKYADQVRDIVLSDSYTILADIQPGQSEQTKYEIMDIRTAMGFIPDLCTNLKNMILKQQRQGFGALTSNMNVYGAISNLFTGLYMMHQAMLKVFKRGRNKEYYNFEDLVGRIEFTTDCTVNAFKNAAPQSWNDYVGLFATFDRDDPNQIHQFYQTGCGFYGV